MTSTKQRFWKKFRNLVPDAVPEPSLDPINPNETSQNGSIEDNGTRRTESKSSKLKNPFLSFTKKRTSLSEPPEEKASHSPNAAGTAVFNIVNSSHVHCGDSFVYNFPSPNMDVDVKDSEESIFMTESISCLMSSSEPPEHTDLDFISKNMSKNWRSFFISAGYSEGQIDTFVEEEAEIGIAEARYKLLLDWTRNDDDGTLGALATLLWDQGQRPVVKGLAALHKGKQ